MLEVNQFSAAIDTLTTDVQEAGRVLANELVEALLI